MLINYDLKFAEENNKNYLTDPPWPHIVIDNFFNDEILTKVHDNFPKPDQIEWHQYNNPVEKKLMFSNTDDLGTNFKKVFDELNSPEFINFLEKLTGIENILPDYNFVGGGLHQIEKGGKLDIHSDFNLLYGTNRRRALNLILYLNKDWQESYGGHLELWDKNMSQCCSKILPIYNRAVIFNTDEFSYHGHPEPLTCPSNMTRKSIAIYYYVENKESVPSRSTKYMKRPQDPENKELDKFREFRSKPLPERIKILKDKE
jgi:Rps23 Pro-64 3,4-dihydroxylase Tpa1-like proline 4-hydroxylase